jgi:beta-lactamase class A
MAGGTIGLYLKEVDEPALAGLNEGYVFEPASSIKVVIHLYAMQQVRAGLSLDTPIPMFQPPPPGDSCPGDTVIGTEPLSSALQRMMQVSDNTATRELMEYFGVDALDHFAHDTLGLADTTFATSASRRAST